VATSPDAATVRKGVEEIRRKRAEKDAADAKAKADAEPADEPDDDQGDDDEAGRDFHRGRNSRSRSRLAAPKALKTGNAAGFILGLIAWAWVGRPLIQGGPTQVKAVLKAKFTNKAPDGSWLP
jgi:hypothetical protein